MSTDSIVTAGYLSQLLQRSPVEIRAAAQRAGISAAIVINGRQYFHESDIVRIREALTSAAERRAT